MKCPNCHCEISPNERICRYCGFDIDYSRRETMLRDNETAYYRNAMQYYEENYRKEKERNDRYRELLMTMLIGLVVVLNILEILLVLWK